MVRLSRIALPALSFLLFAAILTVWLPHRVAVHSFQAGIFLLALPYAVAQAFRRSRRPSPPPSLRRIGATLVQAAPLAGAVLWGLLQLLLGWTVYPFETWNAVLTWATHLVVFSLALQLFISPSARCTFRAALLYFGFVLSVLSLLQYFTAPQRVFWLFPVSYANVGPFLNRDHYSTFVELILPLAVFEAVRDRRKTLSHSLMAGVLFASVIAGASRAGSILVTLEVAFILFLAFSPRFAASGAARRAPAGVAAPPAGSARRALAGVAFFAVVFAAVVGWEVLWRRFQDPDPYRMRREMLQASLVMLRERPLTGFGLGAWSTAYPAYALADWGLLANHAHNDWAQWAVEGGLPFLLLVLAVALWTLPQAVRHPWGIGVVAAFAHCLVDFPMQRLALSALLFALLGALAAADGKAPLPGAFGGEADGVAGAGQEGGEALGFRQEVQEARGFDPHLAQALEQA